MGVKYFKILFYFILILILFFKGISVFECLDPEKNVEFTENETFTWDDILKEVAHELADPSVDSTKETGTQQIILVVKECKIIESVPESGFYTSTIIFELYDFERDSSYLTKEGQHMGIMKPPIYEYDIINNTELFQERVTKFRDYVEQVKRTRRIVDEIFLNYSYDYLDDYNFILIFLLVWVFLIIIINFCYLLWYYWKSTHFIEYFLYCEKKMRKAAFRTISKKACSIQEYEICMRYIKESLKIDGSRYDLFIDENAFEPLIISLEKYIDFLTRKKKNYMVDALIDHLFCIIDFKKLFDYKIEELRKKKNLKLYLFKNKDRDIITHEEIVDFL